jgi:hypothetical protein
VNLGKGTSLFVQMKVSRMIFALLVFILLVAMMLLVGYISDGQAPSIRAGVKIGIYNDDIVDLSEEREVLDQFELDHFKGNLPMFSEEDALDLESLFSKLDDNDEDELLDFEGSLLRHDFGAEQLSDHRILQNGPEMFEIGNNGKFNTPNNKCGKVSGFWLLWFAAWAGLH